MGRKGYARHVRVSAVIRRVVSEQLLEGPYDELVRQVVVTDVEVTPDLRQARVYYNALHDGIDEGALSGALAAARGRIAAAVGRSLHVKSTPRLAFVRDDTADRAQRIEDVLRAIRNGDAGDAS